MSDVLLARDRWLRGWQTARFLSSAGVFATPGFSRWLEDGEVCLFSVYGVAGAFCHHQPDTARDRKVPAGSGEPNEGSKQVLEQVDISMAAQAGGRKALGGKAGGRRSPKERRPPPVPTQGGVHVC